MCCRVNTFDWFFESTMPKPERVMYGEREAMIAEVAAFDPRKADVSENECRYLVMPMGAATWDTEYFPTLKQARKHARDLGEVYNVPVGEV